MNSELQYIEQPLPEGMIAPPEPYVFLGRGPLPEPLWNMPPTATNTMKGTAAYQNWGRGTECVGASEIAFYAINPTCELARKFGIKYLADDGGTPVTHEF